MANAGSPCQARRNLSIRQPQLRLLPLQLFQVQSRGRNAGGLLPCRSRVPGHRLRPRGRDSNRLQPAARLWLASSKELLSCHKMQTEQPCVIELFIAVFNSLVLSALE